MKLFPEYLNQGSKGPAVVVLQLILLALECNSAIVVDGEYGEQTAVGVKDLQEGLNVDQDGNFGPVTRAALLGEWGIDINALDAELFIGETTVPAADPVVT